MQSFTYYSPTKVIFGKNAEENVAKEVLAFGGTKVLIVYGGGSVKRSGLLNRVEAALSAQSIPFQELGGVKPNPRLSKAYEGIEMGKAFGADFILAVGGGSAIDTAKGIAHGIANPNADIWDYWKGAAAVPKSLPVGVVLTISAAGSETSDSAVLTNEKTGEKIGLSTDFNRPKFAIMNPELTFTLPVYQVACGVVDIMMHTLDRYFTHTTGNEFTDELAETLLKNVIRNGAIAVKDPHDYASMSELMWCGSISHNSLTGLGAVTDFAPHGLGHELSAKFDVAHGASLSTIWGAWATYCYPQNPGRFVRYAKNVWGISCENEEDAVKQGIQATMEYFRSIGMPTCFTELGIGIQPDSMLEELADRATHGDSHTVGNFLKITKKDAYEIYRLANR